MKEDRIKKDNVLRKFAALLLRFPILKRFAKRNAVQEAVLYCIIGVTGVSLDAAVFFVFFKIFGVHYQIANIIGVHCGIFNNFLLNAYLNFQRKDHFLFRFLSFYSVGLTGLAMSAALLYLFVDVFDFDVLISKLTVIFIVTVFQFFCNKLITFKRLK